MEVVHIDNDSDIKEGGVKLHPLLSLRAVVCLWIPVAVISLGHYATGPDLHYLHDIFRRLYYIPIILGAFQFGLSGAVATSLVVSIVYIPHAFTTFVSMDPAHGIEKVLEIILYNVVGVVTGLLVMRERRQRLKAERMAGDLKYALEEKREMEQEIIRAGRLAALGELTAGLAHEIRNPLGSLKGTAEILGDEIPADSKRRRMLELHLREIDRLGNILDRFLSFARPQGLDRRDLDLSEVVDDVLALATSQAGRAGVTLDRAPSRDVAPHVFGDREKLTQVVLNLILNGVQAAGKGATVQVSVTTRKRSRRIWACIEV
ncbi:MAG: hypothetical protein GXP54_02460, partial [Deltaproteobacteria bacterium]|nr:hypothetical protein [Deltaproteobacteria bacterium]